jgi:hypothetical protein
MWIPAWQKQAKGYNLTIWEENMSSCDIIFLERIAESFNTIISPSLMQLVV